MSALARELRAFAANLLVIGDTFAASHAHARALIIEADEAHFCSDLGTPITSDAQPRAHAELVPKT